MKEYVYRSGEVHGGQAPAGPSPLPPDPGRATLADRARVARRLAAQDPAGWRERTPESRRLLVNLAIKEAKENR